MNILELREKVIGLKDELNAVLDKGQAETRELTEEENSRVAEIRTEIDNLEAEIEKQEAEDRKLAETNNQETKNNKNMEIRLFNLIKGVAGMQNLSDEERQYVKGQNITLRSGATIQAQGAETTGVEAVPEDKKRLDVAIRNASVLNRLGCTWFANATGDISMPKYSGSMVGWKGEIESADKGEGDFSEVILQPKRLTAIVDVSKTFLAQTAEDAEAILIADLAAAVSEKLDKTVFGAESGVTGVRPAGLFYDNDYTETGSTLGDAAYDDVLDLELGVEEKNGTDFVFIASPNVKYQLKGAQKASGLGMVYDGGEIDGYKALVSNSVAKGGIMALVPRDLAVATWNNVDITVDIYTKAAENQVRLVVNYYVDAALRGDRIAAKLFNAE